MKYIVKISPDAVIGYKDIPYGERAHFRKFISFNLSSNPEEMDNHTIKGFSKIRGIKYSFSHGEVRVFYDVIGSSVEILLIYLSKVLKETGISITKQGVPIETIPTIGVKRMSESEFEKKIDASRRRTMAGEGVLFDDLPL